MAAVYHGVAGSSDQCLLTSLEEEPGDPAHDVGGVRRASDRQLQRNRGCSTATQRRRLEAAGVERIALHHTAPPTAASRRGERERWLERGYRWRAGLEGRIGVLRRVRGLDRCPDHGADCLERWAGLGVLTANLVTIARATADR